MSVELDPTEFMRVSPEGSVVIRTPPDMPIDLTQCACGAYIGFNVEEWVDSAGTEHSGLLWTPTYRSDDGHLVCEECQYGEAA